MKKIRASIYNYRYLKDYIREIYLFWITCRNINKITKRYMTKLLCIITKLSYAWKYWHRILYSSFFNRHLMLQVSILWKIWHITGITINQTTSMIFLVQAFHVEEYFSWNQVSEFLEANFAIANISRVVVNPVTFLQFLVCSIKWKIKLGLARSWWKWSLRSSNMRFGYFFKRRARIGSVLLHNDLRGTLRNDLRSTLRLW